METTGMASMTTNVKVLDVRNKLENKMKKSILIAAGMAVLLFIFGYFALNGRA